MKIGIFSDSHGDFNSLLKGMELIGDVDLIIHTGDSYDDAVKLSNTISQGVIAVKGNTDFFCTESSEKLEVIGDKRVFITHGHKYDVKRGLTNLYYKALELEADIVIFGHSHVPLYIVEKDIVFINPGSTSIPRGSSSPSCCILEIEKDQIKVNLKNIV